MITVETLKRCVKCKTEKPRSEFYAWKIADDGLCADCKECRRTQSRVYYARNREKVLKRQREYENLNREEKRARGKRQYAANKESILARHAAWRDANPEYHAAYYRERYDADPEPWRVAGARYRARRAENGHEPYRRLDIYDRDEGICHLCDEFVEWDEFSIDHIVPISKGGPDTAANVATSHLSCNLSRGAKPIATRGGC